MSADMSCDQLNSYSEDGVSQGDHNCTTASEAVTASDIQRAKTNDGTPSDGEVSGGDGSNGNEHGTSNPSEGISTGAKVGVIIGVRGGVGAFLGGLILLWFHRREKGRHKDFAADGIRSVANIAEKDASDAGGAQLRGNESQKLELEQPMSEMATGAEAQELPAKHKMMEVNRSVSTHGPAGVESRHEMPTEPEARHETPADTALRDGNKDDGS